MELVIESVPGLVSRWCASMGRRPLSLLALWPSKSAGLAMPAWTWRWCLV